MSETGVIRGFKVFNPDWTCRNKQYTCPGAFEEDVTPSVCDRGMHFCKKAADCFNYYSFNPENKVAEVIALAERTVEDGDKCATNYLEIVNTGKGCTGLCNSGNRNSGDWNKCSFSNGCFNTVEPKIYLFNKPSDWTYRDWLNSDARYLLNQIPGDVLEYVWFEDMTDEKKTAHPEAKTTGGYLKQLDNSECGSIWWRGLNDYEKSIIKAIPNFDKEIFKEITGVDVDME